MTSHTANSGTCITITLSHWYEVDLYLYTDTVVHWTWYYMLHWTLLLHVLLIHGYATPSYICNIVTWILCTQLCHVYTPPLHIFIGIHALIVIFLSCGSSFLLHGLLLHVYSCNHIAWLFLVTYIDILVTGHECGWYTMCETKCHMDLSHGGHL